MTLQGVKALLLSTCKRTLHETKHVFKTKARHRNAKEDRRRRVRHKGKNTLTRRNHDFRCP